MARRRPTDSARLLGQKHPDTLTARHNLAHSYWQAGRTTDAINIEKGVAADFARLFGQQHPNTVAAAGAVRAWRDCVASGRVARGGSHPRVTTDPGVTISRHRALVILSARTLRPMPRPRWWCTESDFA
ncbi:tetratricopeptide repeat protein [Parafrankia discariae]|uniref:tetratricopeptide repeat protein n=1 Tax=Parafrankia discariae TaxID=365528 RepID=UPI0009755403|nr:tetratricopeptide repeat protein [Parafrankia discariae]